MSIMLAVITLFAMLMVEDTDADADQAVNHTRNTQPPDVSRHYWTGRIEQDTTWRDTIYVIGDVIIASGATLTLAPNTQVRFMPYHDDTQGGLDSTRAELIVEGRLHAHAGGIVFRSADAVSLGADWYGIVVERGGLADVSNATIRDGLRCLYAEMGGRVRMDHIAFANCGKQTAQSFSQRSATSDRTQVDADRASGQRKLRVQPTQAKPEAARSDSLSEQMEAMVKRYYTEDMTLRLAKKVAGGTVSCFAFTGLALWGSEGDGSYSDSGLEGAALVASAVAIGFSVGFPLGVSSVDPYDSLPKTLLAGVIPGALWRMDNSLKVSGFWMASIVPVISSLSASELSRKPPQYRRVSVGWVPNLKGGLSAIATLRF